VRWLVEDRRVPHYPLAGLKLERPDVDLRHARLPITPEQFVQLYLSTSTSTTLIEGMGGVDRSRLYALAFQTGLRRGELASLSPRSFDLDGDPPTVVIEAASAKARRRDIVPIPPSLVDMLRPWFATLDPSETLFPRLKTRDTAKMIRIDLDSIGVAYEEHGKFRDFHALRHAFVSCLWKSGASAAVIRELSRHRDLRTTQGYSHCDLGDKAAAVRQLPKLPPLPGGPAAGERPAKG
jgi:integrase